MPITLPTGQIIATVTIGNKEYVETILTDVNGNVAPVLLLAPGSTYPGTVLVDDPLGGNELSQIRRVMESVLIELQIMNANFQNSGMLNPASHATLQT